MPYIKSININTAQTNPYPYDVPSIKFAKNIDLSHSINFVIGDNGTGKSTLLESIAFRLQLPHMDGSDYSKKSFAAAVTLAPYLDIKFKIERTIGFFFRAEDFGDYLNSVNRADQKLHHQLKSLEGEVPDHIIEEMKENANSQIHHMRENYGQELDAFSHGEAYLKIMQDKIKSRGIYLLDEPEAALSPSKQLSLIYFIKEHLAQHNSQFIIATHSPMLMSIPGSVLYEVTDESMEQTPLENIEHYTITKNFLNNPEIFLRHLE
jgi:Predicted ATPase